MNIVNFVLLAFLNSSIGGTGGNPAPAPFPVLLLAGMALLFSGSRWYRHQQRRRRMLTNLSMALEFSRFSLNSSQEEVSKLQAIYGKGVSNYEITK